MKQVIVWVYRIIVLVVLLGVPFIALGGISLLRGDMDAVSGATAVIPDADDLSGEYVVLINDSLHDKKGTTSVWVDFFSKKDVPVILDDISCITISGDAAGQDYAELCQARLPANQMTIRQEVSLLTASKAEYSMFDIIVLSKQAADRYKLSELGTRQGITAVEVK